MPKIDLKNVIWKEGKSYIAWNLNTGVSSFGDTRKEAISSLQEALELYFEDIPISKVNRVEKPDLVPLVLKRAQANKIKDCYKSPQEKGFFFVSQKGSHAKFRKEGDPAKTVIVKMAKKDVPYGTFQSILLLSRLKENDFRSKKK